MAELSEEARAELREAVRILREDGVHIHRSYAAFQKTLTEPPAEDKPTEGEPPPVKEPPAKKPAKRGIGLWGGSDEPDTSTA